jgi:ABC-type glycerol-3-phosphate transport system substrate-binding protein
MLKRLLLLMLVAMLVFAACGGDDGESDAGGEGGDRPECSEAAPAADVASLPSDFPLPGEVTLTGESEAGPSVIIEGYFQADLEEAFPEYKEAFESSDYEITKDEQEEDDAEIFFSKDESNGQVNMFAECEGRTKLRITIRPS